MKKILLLVNGDTKLNPNNEPNSLSSFSIEKMMEREGLEVETIKMASVKEAEGAITVDGASLNPEQYKDYIVVRSIMGNVPGDTDKSLRLQKQLENAGAIAQIPADTISNVVDKIKCGNALQKAQVDVVPSVYTELDQPVDAKAVEELGFPCIVKKSLGSGKGSVVIAGNMDEVNAAAHTYMSGEVPRGIVIQKYTPNMTPEIAEQLGVEPTDRSCHFRVMIVGGKVFGANVFYSQPGEYSLNPEQGALTKPIDEDDLPPGVKELAIKAAETMKAERIAAVDIVLDPQGKPQVLDMNVSPNPLVQNYKGKSLMGAIAEDIKAMASVEQGAGFTSDVENSKTKQDGASL